MLSSLTSCLVQHKKVFIPHVGQFVIHYKPATLDFANRLIYPPVNELRFTENGNLENDQVIFLENDLGIDGTLLEEKLGSFGAGLKAAITQSSFTWAGFGELKYVNDEIAFHPQESLLQPIPANKVIRENAHHAVLVGEKEMHSGDTSYITNEKGRRKLSYFIIAGWIIALLAVAFIVYHLYTQNFKPHSSGYRQKAVAALVYNHSDV